MSGVEPLSISGPAVYKYESPDEYVEAQIKRGRSRFEYRRVFFSDVIRYKDFILAYSTSVDVTPGDPIGALSLEVMRDPWNSKPVFYSETANRNGYHEVIFRL